MGEVILVYLGAILDSCLRWVAAIFSATGTTVIALSGIALTFVATLFIVPIRGRALPGGFRDFTASTISGKKRSGSKEEK